MQYIKVLTRAQLHTTGHENCMRLSSVNGFDQFHFHLATFWLIAEATMASDAHSDSGFGHAASALTGIVP